MLRTENAAKKIEKVGERMLPLIGRNYKSWGNVQIDIPKVISMEENEEERERESNG